ncbi:hypothetical protein Efla_000835 [Eimeria flavescens]
MRGSSLAALHVLAAAIATHPQLQAAAATAAAAAAAAAATAVAAQLTSCRPRCLDITAQRALRSSCSSCFLSPFLVAALPNTAAAAAATTTGATAAARRAAATAAARAAANTRLHAKPTRSSLPMSSKQKARGKKTAAAAKDTSKSSGNSSSSSSGSSSSSSGLPAFMRLTPDNNVLLHIHALPGAKTSSVSAFACTDTELTIHIAAPPREGAANEELLDFVAFASAAGAAKVAAAA